MTRIVRDDGFHSDDLAAETFVTVAELGGTAAGDKRLHLGSDVDARELIPQLPFITAIRIAFDAFTDGRGFSLAVRLRQLGFAGRLRAQGHIIADQYAVARRSGFDEVAISEELASRQPVEQRLRNARKLGISYQERLRRRVTAKNDRRLPDNCSL